MIIMERTETGRFNGVHDLIAFRELLSREGVLSPRKKSI